ncbi:hypothetical protein SAVCW2_43050 [Streptomyces avermitilis]|nr:hypothetical protein SAVCW2_43050 [Streptomyces avermitilis]
MLTSTTPEDLAAAGQDGTYRCWATAYPLHETSSIPWELTMRRAPAWHCGGSANARGTSRTNSTWHTPSRAATG